MENKIKVAEAKSFELTGQMYDSDIVATSSELGMIAASRQSISEHLIRTVPTQSDDLLMFGGLTLRFLKERRDNKRLTYLFTAIIDDKFYVADKNIISIWQENPSGKLQYVDVNYWHEIDELPLYDISEFMHETSVPGKILLFHDKMALLLGLDEICASLRSTCIDGYDDIEYWYICRDIGFGNRDFEWLHQYYIDLIDPILHSTPPGYRDTERYASKTKRIEEDKARLQALIDQGDGDKPFEFDL